MALKYRLFVPELSQEPPPIESFQLNVPFTITAVVLTPLQFGYDAIEYAVVPLRG